MYAFIVVGSMHYCGIYSIYVVTLLERSMLKCVCKVGFEMMMRGSWLRFSVVTWISGLDLIVAVPERLLLSLHGRSRGSTIKALWL